MRMIKLGLFTSLLIALFMTLNFALNDDSVTVNTAMVNEKVPVFKLAAIEGGESLTNENLIGDGYKLLNVWASWCGVCKLEHEFLLQLNDQNVSIYGLNYRDNKKDAKAVLRKDGNPYVAVIFDPEGELALDLGVIGTPETFLIDNQGVIIERVSGVLDQAIWDKLFAPYFGR